MIKLKCKKCGQTWYTANTSANQKCCECSGLLIEEEFDDLKSKNIIDKVETEDKGESKVIYINH